MINHDNMMERIKLYSMTTFGTEFHELKDSEKYVVVAKAMMETVVPLWLESKEKLKGNKRAFYLSSEYLMGRFLTNNLIGMGLLEEVKEFLKSVGENYESIEEAEEDPALGNGGLGRLAACFLDSAASLGYPLDGYGIRYDFGLFKQTIENNEQREYADNWTEYGDPWGIRKIKDTVLVSFKDGVVKAVPYDYAVIGYGDSLVNTLRLWKAESLEEFDFLQFNDQNYDLAVKAKNDAENIAKVLYPNDSYEEGKKLRLKQQYFFVSASLQDIIKNYKKDHEDFREFSRAYSIQLNDTHPAVAIPELLRLLNREQGVDWEESFAIVREVFGYTNHTLLAEALEQWPIRYYEELLPEIYQVIKEINGKLCDDLRSRGIRNEELYKYEIIHNGNIRMAFMSIYVAKSVNGVARLHTDLLINHELKDWYTLFPEKFNNKTNGITQRRWLLEANPQLSSLITKLLGSDAWITDLNRLKELEKYSQDEDILLEFLRIKQSKKEELADYIMRVEGIELDTDSIFDIQIKRLHEYKRQLLNAFNILNTYFELKENKSAYKNKRTFIIGGKSAPGYFRAKGIIRYINDIAQMVNDDPDTRDYLRVVFVKNYRVSYAEKLFPAADLSEQISTAGKEASGTGNMKFMLNGAPTIGTLDGANVEIVEEAGLENNFIFGLTVEEIKKLEGAYNPREIYMQNNKLKRVVDTLVDGTFEDHDGAYEDIFNSLINGTDWNKPDNYYLLADFDSYVKAQKNADLAYSDRIDWARKCWINIANSGKFSSDRTITEYAEEIWDIKKLI